MSLLFTLVRSARGVLISALVFSGLSGLLGAALVAAINRALVAEQEALPRLGVIFASLAVAMWIARWLSQAQFTALGQATVARLRGHLVARLAALPCRTVERQGLARQMAVVVEDVGTIAESFVSLPRLVMQAAVVIGCLGYLATLSLPAFALALAIVVGGSRLHYWAVGGAHAYLERARTAEDALYDHFRALFAGAKELKLHDRRREVFLDEVLTESVERVRREKTTGLSIFVAAGSVGAFLFFAVIGSVIFLLGAVLELEPAVRSGYALVFLYLMHPMEAVLEAIPELSRTRIALARIEALCADAAPEASDPAPLLRDEPLRSLQLANVAHAYRRDDEDGVFALGPISLELRAGEVVYVIGGNGSGKTTLAKLLLGLYEPEAGAVLLNGQPVPPAARDAYRQLFSAVFTDFHLFERLLGLAGPGSDARAQHLLRLLDLDHKVTIRDGVFSTTELSRGQQKRLALLVACLEDRPVYLFDEWAADQDPSYKHVFYTQILPELKARGKSVVVITHDERYFGLADRCLKLDAGKLSVRTEQAEPSPRTPRFELPHAPS